MISGGVTLNLRSFDHDVLHRVGRASRPSGAGASSDTGAGGGGADSAGRTITPSSLTHIA